eukprot:3402421-Rhodomonas_salina.1
MSTIRELIIQHTKAVPSFCTQSHAAASCGLYHCTPPRQRLPTPVLLGPVVDFQRLYSRSLRPVGIAERYCWYRRSLGKGI